MCCLWEITRCFRAMNTDVRLVVCAPTVRLPEAARAADEVQGLFGRAEATLSRFIGDSELSRLNKSAGYPFKASPMLLEAVAASVRAARLSDGIFDPTILPCLLAAGYDASFERLTAPHCNTPLPTPNHYDWNDIVLDPRTSTIYLPFGASLDLGGIAKGWTVDRAAERVNGFPGFAVDAGGDIVVGGAQADGQPWTIGIADPFSETNDLMMTELTGGAVCTSSTVRRRWTLGEVSRHHIIDPRTGEPAKSGVVAATVAAGTAAQAETIAKVAIILGEKEGMEFIQRQDGVEGLLVLGNNRISCSPGFKGKRHAD